MQARNQYEEYATKVNKLAREIIEFEKAIISHTHLLNQFKQTLQMVNNSYTDKIFTCKTKVATFLIEHDVKCSVNLLTRESATSLLERRTKFLATQLEKLVKIKEDKQKEHAILITKLELYETALHPHQEQLKEVQENINSLSFNFAYYQKCTHDLLMQKNVELNFCTLQLARANGQLIIAQQHAKNNLKHELNIQMANDVINKIGLIVKTYTSHITLIQNEYQQLQNDFQKIKESFHAEMNKLNQIKMELLEKIKTIHNMSAEELHPSLQTQFEVAEELEPIMQPDSAEAVIFAEILAEEELNLFNDELFQNISEDLFLPSSPITLFSTPLQISVPEESEEKYEFQNNKRQKLNDYN